jgi:hypothetical protein
MFVHVANLAGGTATHHAGAESVLAEYTALPSCFAMVNSERFIMINLDLSPINHPVQWKWSIRWKWVWCMGTKYAQWRYLTKCLTCTGMWYVELQSLHNPVTCGLGWVALEWYFSPLATSHDMNPERTQAEGVRSQRLTAYATALPVPECQGTSN